MAQYRESKPEDDAFKRLSDLQRLGQALFEREAGRLARKHGINDPRVQRMIRTASGAGDMLSALETALEAAPEEVQADQDEIVIYGRVAYDDLKGAASVVVAIEDTEGRVVPAAGSTTTETNGRFAWCIPPKVAAKLAGKDYIVTVRTRSGEVIYRTAETVRLDVNRAFNVEVNLGAHKPIRRPSAESATPKPPQQPAETVNYSVSGRVVDADGKPVAGVLVRVYDKDVRYDDLLGAALTNRKGEFTVTYRRQDFSEGEELADLYFVVVDADGRELLSTVDHVRFNADRITFVILTLPREVE